MKKKNFNYLLLKIKGFLIFIFLYIFLFSNSFGEINTSYLYDSERCEDFTSLSNQSFQPFKDKVNQGLRGGVYWIKVENDQKERIIEISSSKIKNVQVFASGIQMALMQGYILPTFNLDKNQTVYIKIVCVKEAYIPLKSHDKRQFVQNNQNKFLINGFYYGFFFMMFILNIYYFISFSDDTFLFYSIAMLALTLDFFHRDGLTHLIFKNDWMTNHAEMIYHMVAAIIGSLFANAYLRHEIHFPRFKYFVSVLLFLMISCYVLYLLTGKLIWYAGGELFTITSLAMYWFSSLFLFRKNLFYAFFMIAYCLTLFLGFDFYIFPLLGIPNIGMDTNLMKVGGVVEMLILSYAVVYRMRILHKENIDMQDSLFQRTAQIEKLEEELFKLKSGEKNKITTAELSPREVEILVMISNGVPTKEMAEKLFISVNTVKYHIKKLYDKLEISTRQEAKIKAADIQNVSSLLPINYPFISR